LLEALSFLSEQSDAVALAEALRPALLRISRRLRQESQKVGISAQDALLLGFIQRHAGVGVCELADQEQTSRPTMSSHVKRLEASGWIERRSHDIDGRRSGLSITASGEGQIDAIRRRRNDWLAARLAQLDPAERKLLSAAAEPLLKLMILEP
jgi:DNA-binding MarR family transcriptional regulator